MAEETFYYSDMVQKQKIIRREEGKGRTVIHDDFVDRDNNPTDGKSGRLVFDIFVKTTDPDRTRLRQLKLQISAESMTVAEMIEYLKIKDGL